MMKNANMTKTSGRLASIALAAALACVLGLAGCSGQSASAGSDASGSASSAAASSAAASSAASASTSADSASGASAEAQDASGSAASASSAGAPPSGEAPSGEPPSGAAPSGEPPAKPDGSGSAPSGEPPAKPDESDGAPGGGPGGGSSEPVTGTGATTFDADAETTGETYESTAADENAVRAEGATVSIADATITKTGDSSSSEDSDFYGLNAGVLALDGANLTLSGATVNTDSSGSNGIFAYGEGTQATVSDTTIRTTKGNSGGIEVAGGATITATNLDIDTQDESSAAIRSDRGGGTEVVTSGTYATHGKHSPAVYSTADVTVSDAELSAENCEGVVIEGKNSVTLNDCDVTGNINGVATRSGVVNNVMIYQSMSGDASEGTGNFAMKGGTFSAKNGTLFYVTNTSATIDLEDVELDLADDELLVAAGNDHWGTEGSNGATVAFTATDQELSGKITVDEISSLALTLDGTTTYEGAINEGGQAGDVQVTLADDATWTLTADAYVTELTGATADNIDLAGHTLYVNGEAWTA